MKEISWPTDECRALIADTNEASYRVDLMRLKFKDVRRETLGVGDYACECRRVGVEWKEEDFLHIDFVLSQCEELAATYPYHYLFVNGECIHMLVVAKENEEERDARPIGQDRYLGYLSGLAMRDTPPIFVPNADMLNTMLQKVIIKAHDGKERRGLRRPDPLRPKDVMSERRAMLRGVRGIGDDLSERLLNRFDDSPTAVGVHSLFEDISATEGIGKKKAAHIREVMNPEAIRHLLKEPIEFKLPEGYLDEVDDEL